MRFPEYEQFDALALADLVARREIKAEDLLAAAMDRVEQWNPIINAVVLADAGKARAAIGRGLPQGPFTGVPFLLKDLYTMVAGEVTSNGSRLFRDAACEHDSEVVLRHRRAGLVIFGRTTAPELGLTASTETALWGKTRNPWDPERSSGGSSGGAAAAVAAGILPIAHATDGGGSIRLPSSSCGLFGLKPTRGRLPWGTDLGEGWAEMSCTHAISRTVRDSAAMLDATAGPLVGAPGSSARTATWLAETSIDPSPLRIAIQSRPWNGATVHPDCLAAVDDAAKLCESLGHRVELADLEIDAERLAAHVDVISGGNTLAVVEERLRVLGRELGPDDVEPISARFLARARKRTAAEYAHAVRIAHESGQQVDRFFDRYDLLLTPSTAVPPLPLGRLALDQPDIRAWASDIGQVLAFTPLFNAAGNPAASVPLFWNDAGLPIGVQFAARSGDEATLFRIAGQLERARPWRNRRPPLPTSHHNSKASSR